MKQSVVSSVLVVLVWLAGKAFVCAAGLCTCLPIAQGLLREIC